MKDAHVTRRAAPCPAAAAAGAAGAGEGPSQAGARFGRGVGTAGRI